MRARHMRSALVSGVQTGSLPIAIGLLLRNTDQKSKDYSAIKDQFRPAHADYTYHHKYGLRDYRGGGRSSARETAMRVAAGAIAKKYLATLGIQVRGYMRDRKSALLAEPFAVPVALGGPHC